MGVIFGFLRDGLYVMFVSGSHNVLAYIAFVAPWSRENLSDNHNFTH